jgi:hypothetical protein
MAIWEPVIPSAGNETRRISIIAYIPVTAAGRLAMNASVPSACLADAM